MPLCRVAVGVPLDVRYVGHYVKLLPMNKFTGLVVVGCSQLPSRLAVPVRGYVVLVRPAGSPSATPRQFPHRRRSCEVIACDVPLEGSLSLEFYYIERLYFLRKQ
jgi:hypothetical protein